jgi:hypothetical protein
MIRFGAAAVIFAAATCAANAQNAGAAYGLGVRSCAEFAKAYAANPSITENMYFVWAEGLMSGLNLANTAYYLPSRHIDGGETSKQSYMLTIRMYCDTHPLTPYYAAVASLYNSLQGVPSPPR